MIIADAHHAWKIVRLVRLIIRKKNLHNILMNVKVSKRITRNIFIKDLKTSAPVYSSSVFATCPWQSHS